MEAVLVIGAAGVLLYNMFYAPQPSVKDGIATGNRLPPPRFLYSEPRIWSSAPVDITYRNYENYYGPNNDPRRNYILYGGTRVPHSGYNPVGQTNLTWPDTRPSAPGAVPGYIAQPIKGTGEKQMVTSATVFKD